MTAEFELPLFPLGSVLLPGGRMGLQVFEPRYLSLVARCMREHLTFGVVLIQQGTEVPRVRGEAPPRLEVVGTEARIVDFESRPNGLLGITIEGERRFDLQAMRQAEDGLALGQIRWRPAPEPVPVPREAEPLLDVLAALVEHPMLKQLGVAGHAVDADMLGFALAQWLPLPESVRQGLLGEDCPLERLVQIGTLLREMGG